MMVHTATDFIVAHLHMVIADSLAQEVVQAAQDEAAQHKHGAGGASRASASEQESGELMILALSRSCFTGYSKLSKIVGIVATAQLSGDEELYIGGSYAKSLNCPRLPHDTQLVKQHTALLRS